LGSSGLGNLKNELINYWS